MSTILADVTQPLPNPSRSALYILYAYICAAVAAAATAVPPRSSSHGVSGGRSGTPIPIVKVASLPPSLAYLRAIRAAERPTDGQGPLSDTISSACLPACLPAFLAAHLCARRSFPCGQNSRETSRITRWLPPFGSFTLDERSLLQTAKQMPSTDRESY